MFKPQQHPPISTHPPTPFPFRLSIDAATAAWRVSIDYDETAARAAKAALAGAVLQKVKVVTDDEEGEGEDEEDENEASAAVPAGPEVVLSSNGGDDVALLRCLLQAVPPIEGAACSINGRQGRLYAEKGFVPSEEVAPQQMDGLPVASLPFGRELACYPAPAPRAGRRQEEREQEQREEKEGDRDDGAEHEKYEVREKDRVVVVVACLPALVSWG